MSTHDCACEIKGYLETVGEIKGAVQLPTCDGVMPTPAKFTENGTYTAPKGYAYSPVVVDVEAFEPTGSVELTENGIYDVTEYAEAEVNVPQPSGNIEITENGSYDISDYATANVDVAGLVPSGTLNISANGNYDVTEYAEASVSVPNTYTASDEGKVVSGGELVGQTSKTVTENGTIDTTLNDEVIVNVQPPLEAKTVTPTKQTQVVEPTSPNYGLSRVTVEPIPSQYIVPSGTENIVANGTYDITDKASVDVNVPQGGDVDGLIDGSIVALENDTATKVKREFASVVKRYDYRNLPSGYTQVEYIRANGTQYIDTGVIANSPRTAQFDVEFMSRGVTQTPCGAQKNNANAMIFASIYYYGLTFSYGASSTSLGNLTNNKKYNFVTTLRNGYQTLALDGANQGQLTRTGDLVNDIPFYLFANNNNGTPTGLCDARIYRCAIHNGNSITAPKLCDLVPCREEATGKYGMYDLVSNSFKGNQGTGEFEGGAEIPDLVYGYTSADLYVTEIGDYAFYNNDLSSLTLRANQVVTLGAHALDGTPIANGTGTVYVPSDLVSAYEADSSWSSYNIQAIA